MKLHYTDPNPFVLPSPGSTYPYVPIDARYLEEIMYNINLERGNQNKSQLSFKLYDQFGRTKTTFIPNRARSVINETTLAAFVLYIEDIKEAVESIIEEPDSLKSHFGRCFNAPHHPPMSFISEGLVNRMPSIGAALETAGLPFYTFPDNISGETMHGAYHKFDYALPRADDPNRKIVVDAFSKAKGKLEDGIPMFDRMQNGEWPITKDELSTILGMSIFSKCPTNMPEENTTYNNESDRYKITDHRRMSWAMCAFVIQMLRFQPIAYENFSDARQEIDNQWYAGAWIVRRGCGNWWLRESNVFRMNTFSKSGKWLIRGKVSLPKSYEDDGIIMRVPPPGQCTGMYWFNYKRMIEQNAMPAGPGLAGMYVSMVSRDAQQDRNMDFNWLFHKFQTFGVKTDKRANSQGGTGFACLVSCFEDNTYSTAAYCAGGEVFFNKGTTTSLIPDDQGNMYAAIEGNRFDPSTKIGIFGAPITEFNLFKAFQQAGVTMHPTTNFLTDIHMIAWDNTHPITGPRYCDNLSPGRLDGYNIKVESVSLIDDMIHRPEEFLEDE